MKVVPSAEKAEQTWKYTTGTPASDWYLNTYNDTNWNSGKAGFGTYGIPGAVVRTIWNSSDIWIRRTVAIGDLSGINTTLVWFSISKADNLRNCSAEN